MNRPIEDRLVAALDARAEQVRPEDLDPIEVPEHPRRPRPAVVLLLVAAAAAVAVTIPFVLGGGDDDSPSPAPSPTETPSVTERVPTESTLPSDPPTVADGMVVVDRQEADVDGDGLPDDVYLSIQGTDPDEPGDGSLEVTLGAGGSGAGTSVPFGYPGLVPPLDLNGDGREQVLVTHTQGGDSGQLLVYTWHEGGITEAQYDGKAPLGIGVDGGTLVEHYYVDDGVLFSWRRLDPVEPDSSVFNVEQWSWTVDGDRLEATKAGDACVDIAREDPPQPC